MANKLKIYACSGIGDTTTEKITYDYWLDNINPVFNTQAVNALNVDINLLVAELNNLDLTNEEKIERLNTIDLYTLCLSYAQDYSDQSDMLKRAGRAIGKVVNSGAFNFNSLNNTERDAHLDELFERVASAIENDDNKSYNAQFEEWWRKRVMDLNKVGLTAEQQQIKLQPISGIGAAEDALNDLTIGGYLQNAATYFMYIFFTDEQLRKLPSLFSSKKKYQMRTYNFCKDVFVRMYGTEEAMLNIIRAGIIQRYGETPGDICNGISTLKDKYKIKISGIGSGAAAAGAVFVVGKLTADALIGIITAVLTFLAAVIGAIIKHCTRVKELQSTPAEVRASTDEGPAPSDFDGFVTTITKPSTLLPILAIAVGIFLIIKD